MAWIYLTFKKLAYKIGSSDPVEVSPYICSAMSAGATSDAVGSQLNNYWSNSYRDDSSMYPYVHNNIIGFDLYPILSPFASNTEVLIFNPAFRTDVGFRVSINKNTGQVTFKRVWFGTITETRTFSYGLGATEIHINLSFVYNNETNTYILIPFCCGGWRSGSYNYAYLYYYSSNNSQDTTIAQILYLGNEYIPPTPPGPDQPYGDDDYSAYVGGDGDHDDTSDTIAESTLPSIGASNSGFCTAYVPTIAQIQELAQRLTDPTIYQALGNTVLNISDVVIGLHVLPVAVPKATSTRQVCVNFLGIGLPAGVYIDKATTQFVEVDCGSLNVTEYWGNCVDYNPYTQIGIFLPFCGFYELDTDDVMGKTIAVSYRIDIISGACLATIKVDGSVLYQYTGDCANQIPVNSVNFDNFLTNAFNMAIATSTGGAGLAAAGAGASNALEGIRAGGESSVAKQLAEENVLSNYQNVKAQTFGHLAGATAGAVIGAKGQYKHAGCLAGSPGFLGVRKPYLIIKRPEQIIPGNFGKYHGFPANTGATLGDLSGYTVVDEIRLNIPDATVDEIIECEKLLKGGIVI